MRKIVDGNEAASKMAYLFSEVCSIYPITPSSPMANNVDKMSNKDNYNLFHDKVLVSEMQSEAGAAGAMHGALLSGSLASTFTSSQGLLLMLPNMYKIAGEGLPGVMHVASRTIATHALSIFGDHSDVYQARDTGFCMLASTSVDDAYYLSAVAHLSAIKGSLPFMHFFDGFRTSHELNVIDELNEKDLLKLVDKDALNRFKDRSLNINSNNQYGMSVNEDIYFQEVEARSKDYNNIPDIVNNYMESINKLANTNYKPFNYYGDENAKYLIVAMGSVCDTAKLVIDEENKKGRKLGLIEVHLYRPFSLKYLLNVLPRSVKRIAVLDMCKDQGSVGEPLYLDILSCLHSKGIEIYGGRYGLSSKDVNPSHIYSVFNMLENNPKNNFTVGIKDDLLNTSLEIIPYNIDLNTFELEIYGFGSDGMVSASKDIMHILGEEGSFVQGYFSYDSKKSGGVTHSHLRFGDKKINAPYYVTESNLVVVTKDSYFTNYHILDNARENSILLVNSSDDKKLMEMISAYDLDIIKKRNIKVLTIDANKIALENNIPGKINKIIESVILNLLGVNNYLDILNNSIDKQFSSKGEDVINNNKNAIKDASKFVKKLAIIRINKPISEMPTNIISMINHRLGNTLSTSDLEEFRFGKTTGGLTKFEKRGTSEVVSKWNSEACIQCGMCSMICPHAAIRPFLLEDKSIGVEAVGAKKYNYVISVSQNDCTGCGLCVSICPGKAGVKALSMGKKDNNDEELTDKLFNHYTNPEVFNKFSIKGSQFEKPRFEFSGACAGCGEAAYPKLLTQLFGDEIVVANATGCSSIYGGSFPSTPYSIPWANSLFEDNAEFAYGINLSYKNKRERIRKIIKESINSVSLETRNVFEELLDNFDDYKITSNIKNKLLELDDLIINIKELIDYVPSRVVVALGGDGWAYDIGFGGIDHVLSSGENIKVVVLDTEVYSNTGGQSSKSSNIGQVSQFASLGKKGHKKDLFRIAMSYPNCYVGSVSLGANMMQTLKVFKEAFEHKGPSIILCYSPCIEHGIRGGMSCSVNESKLGVEAGYTLLMRYNPSESKLYLDSKEPNFELYDSFLDNEVRYRSLKVSNPDEASDLLELNKKDAINRFNYYKNIVDNQDKR